MATREEIVDEIAGFALFADLATPQLERVAHTFEEQVYAEGERVLRQGLSGSAFHVILDGDAKVVIDGSERATLGRGDYFGEVLDPPRRAAWRRRHRDAAAALPGPRRAPGPAVPARQSDGHVPDAPGPVAPTTEREPVAELTERPFPRAYTRSSSSGAGPEPCRSRTA